MKRMAPVNTINGLRLYIQRPYGITSNAIMSQKWSISQAFEQKSKDIRQASEVIPFSKTR
jgi:hypothetical protein